MSLDISVYKNAYGQSIRQWMRDTARQIIPHKMAICGLAKPTTLGISICHTEAIDMPSYYFDRARHLFPVGCPVLSRWLLARTPQFIESSKNLDQGVAAMFLEFDVQNLLLHGFYDPDSGYVSFFCLYQVISPDIYQHKKYTDLFAEMAHNKLTYYLPEPPDAKKSCVSLTNAEKEILKWLRMGKTNWEIGKILDKSQWTVKTQVQHVLRKMNVGSRHELRDSHVL